MGMLGYRSDDAVITICQNNKTKSIVISDINDVAEDVTGYKNITIAGQPLQTLVPPRIAEMMKEYVEYEPDSNDVGQVLSKVQSFSIVGKDGKEVAHRLKVVRAESTGDLISFKLVLQDKTGIRKNEALRTVIQENFRGHESLDPVTGLPDHSSLVRDIELMGHYSSKGDMQSCFAAIQLDHYDEIFARYGKDTAQTIVKYLGHLCRQSLRPDDVVGSVDHKRLGIILLDTNSETARLAANRLRWQIAANPFVLPDNTTISLSCSICLGRVGGRIMVKDLMYSCCKTLDNLGVDVVNALVEATEHNPAVAARS